MPDAAPPRSSIILYQTEDGRTCIQCRFENETIWLTQALIAELFQVTVPTVNEHLKGIFAEGELAPGGNYSEIPNSSKGGRTRSRPRNRTLQPARHPRRRLPRPQSPGHPIPPVGDRPVDGVSGEGLHHGRRAAQKSAGQGLHRLLRRAARTHPRHPLLRTAFLPEGAGYGRDALGEMQRIIDAEKSDLFDVLAYLAFQLQPVSREQRAEQAKVEISTHFNSKQRVFLEFVLSQYVRVGVDELALEKLAPLLKLKYHNAIADAVADLGQPEEISKAFAGFQKYLCAQDVA